ncbi:Alanine racemase [Candidatus Bealeia paramacronuclearis]|uniref:Alanine racemase n=1 Tax=Candidatus Bealeia paramacronuclearis TaxID=1921001 RepID=A0ABZ2C0W6_9PROT|nr:Alanine racemase [Candidatus Bealeia paramacronuclearis]
MINPSFFSPSTPATLIVDLEAIRENYRILCRGLGPKTACAPAVKANGYGLGMEQVAEVLWVEGAKTYFVIQCQEGVSLRKVLPQAQIYVLSTLISGEEEVLIENNLIPVLCHFEQLQKWHGVALKAQKKLPCGIHIDTGLVRTGFHEKDLKKILHSFFEFLDLKLIMSHLACSYTFDHPMNKEQLEEFLRLKDLLPQASLSLANSGGVHLGSHYHFDLVRPGLALYGSNLTSPEFKPVAHIFAKILQIEEIPAGKSIGYDATFTTARSSRIATLGIGYADGVLRSLSNQGYVFIQGHKFPIVGRISMDLMTVDITAHHGAPIRSGDWVELLGENIRLDDVAKWARTAPWEILTNLGSRYERFYAKENQRNLEKIAS